MAVRTVKPKPKPAGAKPKPTPKPTAPAEPMAPVPAKRSRGKALSAAAAAAALFYALYGRSPEQAPVAQAPAPTPPPSTPDVSTQIDPAMLSQLMNTGAAADDDVAELAAIRQALVDDINARYAPYSNIRPLK